MLRHLSSRLHSAGLGGLATSSSAGLAWPAAARARCISSESSASQQASSSTSSSSGQTVPPKIIVWGGRGFVGSHVCQEALTTGLHVVGISRSGTPPVRNEPWTKEVEWVRGSALEPQTYRSLLQGATAVISCIGAFGSQAEMMRLNGTANVTAIEEAKAAGVPRFVFISATIPNVPGIGTLLQGYVEGKAVAEKALERCYPGAGVALRPGVIYGPRAVSSTFTLPLQYLFQPVESVINMMGHTQAQQLARIPLLGAAFVPPLSASVVARAAVRAATDPAVPAGPMSVWDIKKWA